MGAVRERVFALSREKLGLAHMNALPPASAYEGA
jgi:hypothetical protein